MAKRRAWTLREEAALLVMWQEGVRTEVIAQRLGRSMVAIHGHLQACETPPKRKTLATYLEHVTDDLTLSPHAMARALIASWRTDGSRPDVGVLAGAIRKRRKRQAQR